MHKTTKLYDTSIRGGQKDITVGFFIKITYLNSVQQVISMPKEAYFVLSGTLGESEVCNQHFGPICIFSDNCSFMVEDNPLPPNI